MNIELVRNLTLNLARAEWSLLAFRRNNCPQLRCPYASVAPGLITRNKARYDLFKVVATEPDRKALSRYAMKLAYANKPVDVSVVDAEIARLTGTELPPVAPPVKPKRTRKPRAAAVAS